MAIFRLSDPAVWRDDKIRFDDALISLLAEPEDWRPIPGFPYYEISSLGRVKSKRRIQRFYNARFGRTLLRTLPERIMALYSHRKRGGYLSVGLSKKGRVKTYFVHRLVCEAFHGPAPAGKNDVAHSDGDPSNARADNLRWASRRENMADCLLHGTRAAGEKHGGHAISDKAVSGIRTETGLTQKQISLKYGIAQGQVAAIINNKSRKDPNYIAPTGRKVGNRKISAEHIEIILSTKFSGRARGGVGVSQAALAKQIGVTQSRISQILLGIAVPTDPM